jgi:phosphate transport system substrate-binding protein
MGATDAPPTAVQYAAFPSAVVTIPESISGVVPAYNIPGIKNGLNFTGNILAEIFYGTITQWNDPQLVALNPGVTLPAHAITVVHRSDGSGTMFAFTNYLSDSNATWKAKIGTSTLPAWPVGLGCKGNEGVAGCIENTQYSIGPLEIAYVYANPGYIQYGQVRNAAGVFVNGTETSIGAAVTAGASVALPAGNAPWTSVSLINNIYNDTAATTAYPIITFTYLVVYIAQPNLATGELAVNFLWWIINHGQTAGIKLGYIPLPANIVTLDDTSIGLITSGGTSICSQAPSVCT